MTWALYTILAVPLAAVALTLVDGWRLARAATCVSGLVSLALAILIAIKVDHGRVLGAAGGWLRVDSLGAVFLLATGLLYAMAGVFSIGYLGVEETRPGFPRFAKRYYALLNLFGWSMLLVPLAADFGTLWVAVELTTIISALLVAIDRTDAALEASWKYVLIASSGLGIALLSIIVLYATGTHVLGSAYVPRFERFLAHAHGLSPDAVRLAFVLSLVGFGTKVGFVPMHTWLPDAHSEAPSPISALLSGVLLNTAMYGILRYYALATPSLGHGYPNGLLLAFGLLSLLIATLFILRQSDVKRLLAYSSVEHMGIVAVGISFGGPLGLYGALLQMIGHALAKSLLFFASGQVGLRYGTKQMDRISGVVGSMPITGTVLILGALALTGSPPFGIFVSEFSILSAGFRQGQTLAALATLILIAIIFIRFLRPINLMAFGRAPVALPRGEISRTGLVAMLVSLVLIAGLGVVIPAPLSELLRQSALVVGGTP